MTAFLAPEIAVAIALRETPREALVPIPVGDVSRRRQLHESALAATDTSVAPGVSTKDFHIASADGTPILCRWYQRDQSAHSAPSAAIVYFHGGGYILGSVDLFDGVCSRYVAACDVPILSVDYRLAPEHPFPSSLEDAYAALDWLHSHASTLNVKKN